MIKPLHDRIIVQPDEIVTKTKSGIYIPETAQESSVIGTVVAIGDGKRSETTNTILPLIVQVGDRVLYGKFSGQEIDIEGDQYLIMRESDLYAVI